MSLHQPPAKPARKPQPLAVAANKVAESEKPNLDTLDFPGRTVLYVREVAEKLRVTDRHVTNLIEAGQLRALNVATGAKKSWRIPVPWYRDYVKRMTDSA